MVARRRATDRPGDVARRRLLAGCIGFFAVMLAIAAVWLLAVRDASGAAMVVVPLVATYLASSAWLTATVVLLRGGQRAALTAWVCGGGALLITSFLAQVVVARGA